MVDGLRPTEGIKAEAVEEAVEKLQATDGSRVLPTTAVPLEQAAPGAL